MNIQFLLALLLLPLTLYGCGGGGGSSAAPSNASADCTLDTSTHANCTLGFNTQQNEMKQQQNYLADANTRITDRVKRTS